MDDDKILGGTFMFDTMAIMAGSDVPGEAFARFGQTLLHGWDKDMNRSLSVCSDKSKSPAFVRRELHSVPRCIMCIVRHHLVAHYFLVPKEMFTVSPLGCHEPFNFYKTTLTQ